MKKTVDNIPYLCSVAGTGTCMGVESYQYEAWLKKQTCKTDQEYIEKYIPLFEKKVYTDIDMFTLPKVFRVEQERGNYILDRILSLKDAARMDLSVNYEYKLVLVL